MTTQEITSTFLTTLKDLKTTSCYLCGDKFHNINHRYLETTVHKNLNKEQLSSMIVRCQNEKCSTVSHLGCFVKRFPHAEAVPFKETQCHFCRLKPGFNVGMVADDKLHSSVDELTIFRNLLLTAMIGSAFDYDSMKEMTKINDENETLHLELEAENSALKLFNKGLELKIDQLEDSVKDLKESVTSHSDELIANDKKMEMVKEVNSLQASINHDLRHKISKLEEMLKESALKNKKLVMKLSDLEVLKIEKVKLEFEVENLKTLDSIGRLKRKTAPHGVLLSHDLSDPESSEDENFITPLSQVNKRFKRK